MDNIIRATKWPARISWRARSRIRWMHSYLSVSAGWAGCSAQCQATLQTLLELRATIWLARISWRTT